MHNGRDGADDVDGDDDFEGFADGLIESSGVGSSVGSLLPSDDGLFDEEDGPLVEPFPVGSSSGDGIFDEEDGLLVEPFPDDGLFDEEDGLLVEPFPVGSPLSLDDGIFDEEDGVS